MGETACQGAVLCAVEIDYPEIGIELIAQDIRKIPHINDLFTTGGNLRIRNPLEVEIIMSRKKLR